jgi:YVTN family beta-propeller protein
MKVLLASIAAGLCLLALTGCRVLAPFPPDIPSGPGSGEPGTSYAYSTQTTDPQGDRIAYRFSWGDGQTSDWSDFMPSGTSVTLGHSWPAPGEYAVTAQAKDVCGFESDWSNPHRVTIREPGFPDSVVAVLTGMSDPVGIACSPDGRYVYVAARGDNEVVVIRSADNQVVARVRTGSGPHAVCVLPDGKYAYVANCGSGDVAAVRLSDNTLVATVAVGGYPLYCQPTMDGQFVYVTNWSGQQVNVIRTSDNTLVATVATGGHPWGIAASPDARYMYVGLSSQPLLKVFDAATHAVVGSVAVHAGPEGLNFLPGGEYLYVACRTGGGGPAYVDVLKYPENERIASPAMGGYPVYPLPTPNGRFVYVSCHEGESIHVMDAKTNEVVWSHSGPVGPCYMTTLPCGGRVYACANYENKVYVFGRRGTGMADLPFVIAP